MEVLRVATEDRRGGGEEEVLGELTNPVSLVLYRFFPLSLDFFDYLVHFILGCSTSSYSVRTARKFIRRIWDDKTEYHRVPGKVA